MLYLIAIQIQFFLPLEVPKIHPGSFEDMTKIEKNNLNLRSCNFFIHWDNLKIQNSVSTYVQGFKW